MEAHGQNLPTDPTLSSAAKRRRKPGPQETLVSGRSRPRIGSLEPGEHHDGGLSQRPSGESPSVAGAKVIVRATNGGKSAYPRPNLSPVAM